MISQAQRFLARFRRDSDGTITIEALLVIFSLLWLFGVVWVWFDVSRQQALNQKTNYTIADAISRETDPLNDAFLDGALELQLEMTRSSAAESDLRVTVVEYIGNGEGRYDVVWSEARGNYPPLVSADLEGLDPSIPMLAHKDQIILVETWEDYNPALPAGLSPFEIRTYSFARPRFAPQVHLLGTTTNGNNGWGNGDQDAPGASLCNNNAENADEGDAAIECQDNADGKENQGNGQSKKG